MKNTIRSAETARAFSSLAQSSCSRRYTPLYSPTRPKNRIPPVLAHSSCRTTSFPRRCRFVALARFMEDSSHSPLPSRLSPVQPHHMFTVFRSLARAIRLYPTKFFKKLAAFASIRGSKSMSKSVKSGPACGRPSSVSRSATTAFSTLSRFHGCSRHFTGNPTASDRNSQTQALSPPSPFISPRWPNSRHPPTRHGALPAVYCAQLDILGRAKKPSFASDY